MKGAVVAVRRGGLESAAAPTLKSASAAHAEQRYRPLLPSTSRGRHLSFSQRPYIVCPRKAHIRIHGAKVNIFL